jgi:exosortase
MKFPPHNVSFCLLLAVSVLVGWRPLVDTSALALRDDSYTHILLILPVSAALIFLEWRSLRPMSAPNVRAGSALLAMALLIAGFMRGWSASLPADVQLSISMFALVLSWIAAFVLCFGSQVSRALLFPLCFLFWLVPFPRGVLDGVINLLQQGSALTAHALFTATGVPVAQDGFMLTIPGLTVEVAQECSSIRSSSMLLATTMVLAQLMLRSPWRKALVIAVAVPLSVAKNGLRIFTIAMLATRVDPGYMNGRLHHQGGIVFFAIALFGIFALLWILRRTELKSLPTLPATTVGIGIMLAILLLPLQLRAQNAAALQSSGNQAKPLVAAPASKPAAKVTDLQCVPSHADTASVKYAPPTALVKQHSVDLSWKASVTVGAGYNVYRCTPGNSCSTATRPLAIVTSTSYHDPDVQPRQAYCYFVTAFIKGRPESDPSNIVYVTIPPPLPQSP